MIIQDLLDRLTSIDGFKTETFTTPEYQDLYAIGIRLTYKEKEVINFTQQYPSERRFTDDEIRETIGRSEIDEQFALDQMAEVVRYVSTI